MNFLKEYHLVRRVLIFIILLTKSWQFAIKCFQVFGLGNKTYENYNTMGRFFDKRLSELGCTRLFERGEGDDDGE